MAGQPIQTRHWPSCHALGLEWGMGEFGNGQWEMGKGICNADADTTGSVVCSEQVDVNFQLTRQCF